MTGNGLSGMRVMVAEDELLIAMLIEDVLADAGCLLVGPFCNVSDALAAARDATIDIALLDVNLRGQKIYPAAEALAARRIPFLLLSGYGRDAIPPNHPDWEACAKPFKSAELTKMLSDRVHAGR
jgi:CheY-like chemotaxis protein